MQRATAAILTALGVVVLVFLALRLVPGDPVDLMLGESATPASREQLRHNLGLDQGLGAQFSGFVTRLAHGDLGQSLSRRQPVARLLAAALPNTALLAAAAMAFALALGVPLGTWAATRQGTRAGNVIFFGSIAVASFPVMWLGPLLVVAFALHWPWLPVSSFHHWSSLVLPALAAGLGLSAHLAQTTRAAVAETLARDFVRVALAKGMTPARALFRHALPVAAAPILTTATLELGHLLAGSIVLETIFNWPGLGRLAHEAILQRDYPTVQGVALVIALLNVALNMAVDAWNARLEP